MHRFLTHKFSRWMQSQAAEDGFNICQNTVTLARNKRTCIHTLCNTQFCDGMLAKRHKVDEVVPSYFSRRQGFTQLPEDAFRAETWDDEDPPYRGIVGKTDKTAWWKTGAHEMPV
eukprot:615018-Pyramimonas_sp.AAC.1